MSQCMLWCRTKYLVCHNTISAVNCSNHFLCPFFLCSEDVVWFEMIANPQYVWSRKYKVSGKWFIYVAMLPEFFSLISIKSTSSFKKQCFCGLIGTHLLSGVYQEASQEKRKDRKYIIVSFTINAKWNNKIVNLYFVFLWCFSV